MMEGMPTPSLVVGFDLDLTLVDSRERIMSSYLRALHDVGAPVTREDLEPHLGIPLAQTVAAVAPAVDADALVLRYRRYYDEASAPSTEPMPGAIAAVRALRASGGRVVVVSAKFTPAAHTALAEAGLDELVDAVHGELFAAEKATALLAEGATVYVGDHPGDMAAAEAAGTYAVGVATGANDEAALKAAGADEVLASLEDFPAWLSGHLSRH
jgi:phosphoglycolate phosphatase